MGLEKDDIEFNEHLADRRHKELVSLLRDILQSGEKDRNQDVVSSLSKHSSSIQSIADAIKQIPKPDAPSVSVSTDNSELSGLLQKIHDKLCEAKPEAAKPEWEFKVERNQAGFINFVTARQK